MREKDRESGIDAIGNVYWGTHLCQFYRTREDLVDILVPYFKAGLENNELCLWITSKPLEVEEAKSALEKAVENINDYFSMGQIKLFDYEEWYTRSGRFEGNEVLLAWYKEENQALLRGFEGLRAAGDICSNDGTDWTDLMSYEAAVHNVINNRRMIALCSYCFDQIGPGEVVDIIRNHHIVLSRHEDKWGIIEKVEHTQARSIEKRRKKEKPNQPAMLTVSQAAEFLGLHINTVRRWSQEGILRSHRLGSGRHRRFLREDLERFLQVH